MAGERGRSSEVTGIPEFRRPLLLAIDLIPRFCPELL
jgi:hypothetical protein